MTFGLDGFSCMNADQPEGKHCYNYEVSINCNRYENLTPIGQLDLHLGDPCCPMYEPQIKIGPTYTSVLGVRLDHLHLNLYGPYGQRPYIIETLPM